MERIQLFIGKILYLNKFCIWLRNDLLIKNTVYKQHWVKFYEDYLKGDYKLSLITNLATNSTLPFTEDDNKNGGLYEK